MSVTKIKSFLLSLYPELSRLRHFDQISAAIIPAFTPRIRRVVRWGLPIVTAPIVLFLGITIGRFVLGFFIPKEIVPKPVELITPAPTSTYQSTFLPLKRSIEDFNPNLPDPLPPVFDDKISLEPIIE